MGVKPAMLADLLALRRRPHRRVFFPTEAMLASSYRPFVVGARSALGPLGNDVVTLVLRTNGVRGFVQARKRPHFPEIDLSYLASFDSRNGKTLDGDTAFRLIEGLIERAAQARIERVFAAVVPRFDDMAEVLRQLGFQPYTQQHIWMLPEPVIEAGSALLALRRQQRRDVWAIQQLYARVTPRHVQHAEQRSSNRWLLPRPRRGWGWHEQAWVLGDDQMLQLHLHAISGPHAHVLRMQCDPDLRHDLAPMLRYALSRIDEPRTVFAIVRAYQNELSGALEEVGFRLRGEQTLFVKQLAIRQPQLVTVPTL
jgi:hypothetical protein